MTQCPYAPDSSPESEADTIIREGIPLNTSPPMSNARRPNAYVYREAVGYSGESRLVIIPEHGYGGWLFIDIADITGDIAPGH